MKKKRQRFFLILCGFLGASCVVFLILFALRDTLVFSYSPSEVLTKQIPLGTPFRLGGMVAQGTLQRKAGNEVSFTVKDRTHTLSVRYKGILPDLFREKQGVIAEGYLETKGSFLAQTILAKHDERYMPKEVYEALKQAKAPSP